jgi:hypothetical protein
MEMDHQWIVYFIPSPLDKNELTTKIVPSFPFNRKYRAYSIDLKDTVERNLVTIMLHFLHLVRLNLFNIISPSTI